MPNIILVSGNGRAGKSTVAQYLTDVHHYESFAFASKVREVASALEVKITVNGHEVLIPFWDGTDENKRHPLVEVGHKLRGILGEDVWVNALAQDSHFQEAVSNGRNIVIADNRYANETNIVPQGYDLTRIHVTRDGCEPKGAEAETIDALRIHDIFKHHFVLNLYNNFQTAEDYYNHIVTELPLYIKL